MKFSQEIDLLIRARYPLINVISLEDERVITSVRDINKDDRNLFIWTFGEGFENRSNPDSSCQDPLMALDKIDRHRGDGIFILKDFHLFWKDNRILVKLHSLGGRLQKSTKNIIFITPNNSIPPELKDNITILYLPLPDYNEMEKLLDEILELKVPGNIKERIVNASLGLTGNQAQRVFCKAITKHGFLDESSIEQILYEKKQIIGETRALQFFSVNENLGNVGGLEELKDWIKKREVAFTCEAKDYGLPNPKGLLLVGIPGTGKSLVAKVISSLWKMPLLRLDVGAIFGNLVGQSEENIRRAINLSETIAPCIMWIDEIEKGLFGQNSYGGDSGVTARVSSTLLTWLQEKDKPVFVVATANDISGFALEELRMGRFDAIFFLDLPDEAERREIFRVHLEKRRPVIRHYNISHLASITNGYTGAEIEQLIIEAMYNAFYDDGRDFNSADIEEAIKNIIPSSEMMREKIDDLRFWVKANRIRSASRAYVKKARSTIGNLSDIKVEPYEHHN